MAAVKVQGRKHVRYAKTRQEARERLAELLVRAGTGRLSAPSSLTLQDWAARWLALVAPERRPATLRTYTQTLGPVLKRLGRVRLSRLTPGGIALALAELRTAGMGTRQVQLAYATLRACLEQAVRLGELADNPAARVEKPRHEPGARRPWTPEETAWFVRVASESELRYAPLLLLLLGGGLRLSEALALRWEDIDFAHGTARIDKALVWAGSRPHLGPPKSRAGERTVTLPSWALGALARLPRPMGGGPVFVTAGGRPPGEGAARRTLRRLCEQAGLPVLRPHDLRHQHASLLLAEGLALTEVSARLGHASPTVTLAVYAHHLKRREDRAVRAMERLASPGTSTLP